MLSISTSGVNAASALTVNKSEAIIEKVRIKAVDLLAQALCHEIDHLNGITFVDIMEEGTLQYVEPEK